MVWYIYKDGRQGEVLDMACEYLRECAEGKHEGGEAFAQTIKSWILDGKWAPGLHLHVRDGVASLEGEA